MGVKSAKSKQAKRELKGAVRRDLKADERCPHCKNKVQDLEKHLREEHNLSCARCGKLFASEIQWKQHMKDRHGLDQKTAKTDDKKKRIEKWVKKDRAQAGDKGDDKAAMFSADSSMVGEDAAGASAAGGMGVETNPFDKAAAPTLHRHTCEICGAESMLPINLESQGLSFSCSFVGQQCRGSGSSMLSSAAASARWTAPAPAHSFAAAAAAAPPPAGSFAAAAFGGGAAFPPAAAVPMPVAPAAGFPAAPVGSAFCGSHHFPFAVAGMPNGGGSAAAVGMAVPDDDDDL